MAENDIIQSMIPQLGQSQYERMPEELRVHFADVDERKSEDLLLSSKSLAKFVNYYRENIAAPAGDWTNFFPYDEKTVKTLVESKGASTSPHLALFLSFLELYKKPQKILNDITGRHLDFYYRDVLRLTRKAAIPDKAHVLLELKRQSSPVTISPTDAFSAGKDKSGAELIYASARETVINTSKVDSLRSIFVDNNIARGAVRYAPIANSSDGLGGKLPANEPKWHGFGYENLPLAEVGFAIASPVLRMREGERKITVRLTLNGVDSTRLNTPSLEGAFDAYITGEKNWASLDIVSLTLSPAGILQLEFAVPETEKAVIDYDAAIHGYSYTAHAPIVQVLLRAASTKIGYEDFRGVTLQKARVSVDVSAVTSLNLESDGGSLDPKKAFLPFGPQPTRGSRFMVGYDEALSKKLSELKIKVQWKDAPANFVALYENYGVSAVNNSYFTAAVSFKDAGSWENQLYGVALFESANATSEHTITFAPGSSSVSSGTSTGMSVYGLSASGSPWAMAVANAFVLTNPVFSPFKATAPEPRTGFIIFSLEKDFLHATYRQEYVKNVMTYSKAGGFLIILNEPYTPTIQNIALSYKAHSDEVAVSSTNLADFSNPDFQFYQIAYFGQMREHGYQRNQFNFLINKSVSLLCMHEYEGEFLVGFNNLNAGDSVSVLFQIAEGSADPELEQEDISWSVLCDNYWKPLGSDGVVLDTTNQLLASGIITFVISAEATTQNTILPTGRIWLRAGIAHHVTAVCQLIEVAANAVEVQFTDRGNDRSHLSTALEAGKIAKLKNGLSAVKSVKQPYASFGGSREETDDDFYRRVSERLRHKNRCITSWDYERVILEAFPKVHKVKCIPHAKEGSGSRRET